jgi:hypothetical protein
LSVMRRVKIGGMSSAGDVGCEPNGRGYLAPRTRFKPATDASLPRAAAAMERSHRGLEIG